MADLAQAIQEYKDGHRTEEGLVARLDHTLAAGDTDPALLLTELLKEHSEQPLNEPVFATLLSRINTHIQSTTGQHLGTQGLMPPITDSSDRTAVAKPAADRTAATLPMSATQQPNARHKPTVGDVVNQRFELEELIGEGGMSRVYRALDRRKLEAQSREPHLAVKVLDVPSESQNTAFMALQREAQKSQALQHKNIVRVYDFDRDGDTVFLTMEHLTGEALSNVIRKQGKQGRPFVEVASLVKQMGTALAHAHEHRIVHADFKPSNVFLTSDGIIKVIDFGIARAYQEPTDTVSDKTLFDPRALGALTPAYASPEMFDDLEPDPKDDIYSLGCVAYELCTGLHPFSNIRSIDAKAAGAKPKRPKGLTQKQWQALVGALAFDRASRTPTVKQFLADFLPASKPKSGNFLLQCSLASLLGLAIGSVVFGYWWLQLRDAAEVVGAADVISPSANRFSDCDGCPKVVALAAGKSLIGSPASELDRRDSEGPRYEVSIGDKLAMSEAEITVRQFREFVESERPQLDGCRTRQSQWQIDKTLSWQNPGFKQTGSHPVTCVSWQDAQGYVAWLSKVSGANYRLPSEAEWEYAARAGQQDARHWQDPAKACRHANVADSAAAQQYSGWETYPCADGYAHTAPVRHGVANDFQLFDMQGNLFEWTQDCWVDNYRQADAKGLPATARSRGVDCKQRVLRGGSYSTAPAEQRLAFRNRFAPDYRANTFGFRVVRTAP